MSHEHDTSLATRHEVGALGLSADLDAIAQRIRDLERFQRELLVEGTDYMSYADGQRPCLLKAGAEQLMVAFGLVLGDIEEVSQTRDAQAPPERMGDVVSLTPGHFEATYKCTLLSRATGRLAGVGIGAVRSDEKRFLLARAKVKDPATGEPAVTFGDQVNAMVKQGKKRALVDAVLTATMASRLFTQDLDEVPDLAESDAAREAPMGLCPRHNVPFVHRTGTRADGTAYDFWACPRKVGGKFCSERPTKKAEGDDPQRDAPAPSDPAASTQTTATAGPTSNPTPSPSAASDDQIKERITALVREVFAARNGAYDAERLKGWLYGQFGCYRLRDLTAEQRRQACAALEELAAQR